MKALKLQSDHKVKKFHFHSPTGIDDGRWIIQFV
jgi:hypothetical protein